MKQAKGTHCEKSIEYARQPRMMDHDRFEAT